MHYPHRYYQLLHIERDCRYKNDWTIFSCSLSTTYKPTNTTDGKEKEKDDDNDVIEFEDTERRDNEFLGERNKFC